MLRRHYPSIAEKDEGVRRQNKKAIITTTLAPVDEHTKADDKPIPHRISTKSSGLTVNSESPLDDSESDRLSAEEDDVFVDGDQYKYGVATKIAMDTVVIPTTPSPDSLNDLGLTENQVREIKEAFLVFDDNGDGCISATELKKLVSSLGYNITEAELMDMMNQIGIDADTESEINFGMFSSLVRRFASEKEQETQLRLAFEEFDGDKKGYIEAHGIKRVLTRLKIEHTAEEIDLMMEVADTNGDGRVDVEEFLQIFKPTEFDGHQF
ncbi:hypothetical protein QZH41_006559 [Actinostola sp. cb2023]|nr:hypothetical protein QZH41_006559 [Actinostola sp. cb2023]